MPAYSKHVLMCEITDLDIEVVLSIHSFTMTNGAFYQDCKNIIIKKVYKFYRENLLIILFWIF